MISQGGDEKGRNLRCAYLGAFGFFCNKSCLFLCLSYKNSSFPVKNGAWFRCGEKGLPTTLRTYFAEQHNQAYRGEREREERGERESPSSSSKKKKKKRSLAAAFARCCSSC